MAHRTLRIPGLLPQSGYIVMGIRVRRVDGQHALIAGNGLPCKTEVFQSHRQVVQEVGVRVIDRSINLNSLADTALQVQQPAQIGAGSQMAMFGHARTISSHRRLDIGVFKCKRLGELPVTVGSLGRGARGGRRGIYQLNFTVNDA